MNQMDTSKLKAELSKYGEVEVCHAGKESFTVLMIISKKSLISSISIPKIINAHVGYVYKNLEVQHSGRDTFTYVLTKKRT